MFGINRTRALALSAAAVAASSLSCPHALASTALLSVPPDLNVDGKVNAADLAGLLAQYGSREKSKADLNSDGVIDSYDLAILLASWSESSLVSLLHVSGDLHRRTFRLSDVHRVEKSPFSSNWTRLWVRLPSMLTVSAIDVPVPLSDTLAVLEDRGWVNVSM